MVIKQELNKQYYELNKEKLREKRKQRYLLNKNNQSEQSLTGQCSENSLNTFNLSEQNTEQFGKSEHSEQKENVQSKVSEQTEPSLNTNLKTEQSPNVQTNPTEQNCSHCLKLEKQLKEQELKIISLQETNQILRKDLAT